MRQKRLLDDHEREITSRLGFMMAMNGYTNGGSIADGTLFWAQKDAESLRVTRTSKGLFKPRRSYVATINGEPTEKYDDIAHLAQVIVERVLDKKPAQAS